MLHINRSFTFTWARGQDQTLFSPVNHLKDVRGGYDHAANEPHEHIIVGMNYGAMLVKLPNWKAADDVNV